VTQQRRLRRLEAVEYEQQLLEQGRRLAETYSIDLDAAMRELRETSERVAKYGHDSEIRRLAQEYGKTEDEIRAQLDDIAKEYGQG
jgi:uncharacterized protein YukE